jgi:hypothetical protein
VKIANLMAILRVFPADSDVVLQLGDEVLDVYDLMMKQGSDHVGIRCLPADLSDLMKSWGVKKDLIVQVAVEDASHRCLCRDCSRHELQFSDG